MIKILNNEIRIEKLECIRCFGHTKILEKIITDITLLARKSTTVLFVINLICPSNIP